ncbi:OXLA-like protein [Mya arenaria]|uniref:OXLA-like protein n=1 Tax=Mya arenaria TaxID=6604 RepID=A0ABY7G1C1_MYAAR|nr:OXLA-like protein [Mya arenaria]
MKELGTCVIRILDFTSCMEESGTCSIIMLDLTSRMEESGTCTIITLDLASCIEDSGAGFDSLLECGSDAFGGRIESQCEPCRPRDRSEVASLFCKTCNIYIYDDCCNVHKVNIINVDGHQIVTAHEACVKPDVAYVTTFLSRTKGRQMGTIQKLFGHRWHVLFMSKHIHVRAGLSANVELLSPIQQDDNYQDFFNDIIDGGLKHAYYKLEDPLYTDEYYRTKVSTGEKRKVTIIGGGIAGLVTAFELAQAGHEVQILELQSRVGGRIKTCREKFFDGMHSEGGAMRLPRNHFLTHAYLDKFQIELRPFQNYQENAYMYLYGDKITMKEFSENNKKYCDKYWPGWDANLSNDFKEKVTGVCKY